jgi:tripartite-type tricarboxylate transporter receptor subunit TctC
VSVKELQLMRLSTFVLLIAMFAVLVALNGAAVAQVTYPTRAVRYIVPYPPGGSTDPVARMISAKLADRLGQPVIVENRPGGNTIIGTEAAARSTPDGHTIFWAGPALFSAPSLFPNLPYDVLRDFAGVATLGRIHSVLVLHPSVPAKNVREVIALAKARPGQLNYAHSGVGTNLHLAGELFNLMAGTKIQAVPYKGSGPLVTDLLGGRVEMSFQIPITVIAQINTGKLRAIAITGEARMAALPQVPTFAEAGVPGYGLTGVTAIVAPAKTPQAVLNRLSREVGAILAMPDAIEFMIKQGGEPLISTAEQTTALIKEQVARYAKIIKDAGIKYEP